MVFYRQILSLTYSFFLWNFRPLLVRALLVNFYIPLFPSLQHVNSENLQNPRRKHDRKVQPRRQQRERREVATMFGKRKKVVDIRSVFASLLKRGSLCFFVSLFFLVNFGSLWFEAVSCGWCLSVDETTGWSQRQGRSCEEEEGLENCQRRSFEVKKCEVWVLRCKNVLFSPKKKRVGWNECQRRWVVWPRANGDDRWAETKLKRRRLRWAKIGVCP